MTWQFFFRFNPNAFAIGLLHLVYYCLFGIWFISDKFQLLPVLTPKVTDDFVTISVSFILKLYLSLNVSLVPLIRNWNLPGLAIIDGQNQWGSHKLL